MFDAHRHVVAEVGVAQCRRGEDAHELAGFADQVGDGGVLPWARRVRAMAASYSRVSASTMGGQV